MLLALVLGLLCLGVHLGSSEGQESEVAAYGLPLLVDPVSLLASDSVVATVPLDVVEAPVEETWRQIAKRVLKEEGVYSPANYELLKHCIWRESGADENAVNGQYLGSLQYGRSWKGSRRQKFDYEWSFRRWTKVLKAQGKHGIWKHWCQWHSCGRHY